jgi:hypothetical protein
MVARALAKLDHWNLVILRTQWGVTPNSVKTPDLDNYVSHGLTQQPEISVQVALPSEFKRIGKYSIGVTAVTETHVCPPSFLEGANRVDLVLVPSEFSKGVLINTILENKNPQGQVVQTLRCNTPVDVLFEGIDADVFCKKTVNKQSELYKYINQTVKEDFCFLFVGHWLDAPLGHDRKDVGMLVKTFFETFKGQAANKPALLLKTSGAGFSYMERDKILQKIADIREHFIGQTLPNVYLLNGDLSDAEMNDLYNHHKVKSLVSFTKGEGYGLPFAEFSTTGKPILAPAHSGHLDFVRADYSVLLPGKLDTIHPKSANEWLPREGQWFNVNYQYASKMLMNLYSQYPKYLARSQPSIKWITDNFSFEKMTQRLDEIIGANTQPKPQERLTITLPKLNK